MITGQEFFGKNYAIENTANLPYIVGRNLEKEELLFDSLCNGCISIGCARKDKY